jgi:ELMO/CED-12 family
MNTLTSSIAKNNNTDTKNLHNRSTNSNRRAADSAASPRALPPHGVDESRAASHPIGRWVSEAGQAVSSWTAKKYALPDKTVASQILMYRQMLHTSCRPGLVLSRKYEATPAQVSVQHMPWWETTTVTTQEPVVVDEKLNPTITATTPTPMFQTCTKVLTMVDTGKMVISYDNLITRLWNTGLRRHSIPSGDTTTTGDGIHPTEDDGITNATVDGNGTNEFDCFVDEPLHADVPIAPSSSSEVPVVTVDDATKVPPIPHEFWVTKLGFQLADPVTDFRSGGVLSLGLMVWIVEHCPNTYRRFCSADDPVAVLPFGITSINVTDMIAKILMLSKRTDRMDALLSQKTFWKMFSDPYAILTVQELALELLADVVQELVLVRQTTNSSNASTTAATTTTTTMAQQESSPPPLQQQPQPLPIEHVTNRVTSLNLESTTPTVNATTDYSSYVSVFDFAHVLTVTEQRVEYDLLGAGPISVQDLRQIFRKLRLQYQTQLQNKLDRIVIKQNGTQQASPNVHDTGSIAVDMNPEDPCFGNDSQQQSSPPRAFHEKIMQQATTNKLFGSVVSTTNGFLANCTSSSNPLWNKFKKKNDDNASTTPSFPSNSTVVVPNDRSSNGGPLTMGDPHEQQQQQLPLSQTAMPVEDCSNLSVDLLDMFHPTTVTLPSNGDHHPPPHRDGVVDIDSLDPHFHITDDDDDDDHDNFLL